MFKIKLFPYTLQFKRPAGTSRGVYLEHKVWYVLIYNIHDESHYGIGECAPLPDLSCDYSDHYEETLHSFCKILEEKQMLDSEIMRGYPSILFGLEAAIKHYENPNYKLWDTGFTNGKKGIPINGLIWMGDYNYMLEQIEAKMDQGFRCIKLKIGAIDFDQELSLLRHIRKHFSAEDIVLRVDANGGFNSGEALDKLKRLAELDLHSIEQPIKAGQWEEMAKLASESPLPIALDEELIGCNKLVEKKELLEAIHPQYIILKPTLHGGMAGSDEWVMLAESMGIGGWITSALESNIGLNCIAQWCSTFNNTLPQGLGTGMLYTNNINMPLEIRQDYLWFNPDGMFPDRKNFGE